MYRGRNYPGDKFWYFPHATVKYEARRAGPRKPLFAQFADPSDDSDAEFLVDSYQKGKSRNSSVGLLSGSPKSAREQPQPRKRMFINLDDSDSDDLEDIIRPIQPKNKSPTHKNESTQSNNTIVEFNDDDMEDEDSIIEVQPDIEKQEQVSDVDPLEEETVEIEEEDIIEIPDVSEEVKETSLEHHSQENVHVVSPIAKPKAKAERKTLDPIDFKRLEFKPTTPFIEDEVLML